MDLRWTGPQYWYFLICTAKNLLLISVLCFATICKLAQSVYMHLKGACLVLNYPPCPALPPTATSASQVRRMQGNAGGGQPDPRLPV